MSKNNIIGSQYFASDGILKNYLKFWDIQPCKVPKPENGPTHKKALQNLI